MSLAQDNRSKPADNRILVVDSSSRLGTLIGRSLHGSATIERASSGDTALQLIALQKIDLVVTQLKLPLISGLDLAAKLKKVRPYLPLLVVTSGECINDSIELTQLGYPPAIRLPEGEADLLRISADILEANEWVKQARQALEETKRLYGFDKILSSHPSMSIVHEKLKKLVNSKVPVLVTGESGTGKELIARMIHATSDRSKRTFITVNCAAVPEGLLESQFFGHEKGAFTGAAQRFIGKFELSNNGTLFLDEIGEMTPSLQAKLLRVIEYGEFERVGGSQTLKVDVRLITATNRNLETLVETGAFRTDLFYRINVFPIKLPPLRERGEDVILLAYHFLSIASRRNNRQVCSIHPESLEILKKYPWQGNIRELENAIERAVLLCDGLELKPVDFPTQTEWLSSREIGSEPESDADLPMDFDSAGIRTLAEIEQEAIRQALDSTGGKVALAARRLGIARGTLYKKMEEHNIINKDNKNGK